MCRKNILPLQQILEQNSRFLTDGNTTISFPPTSIQSQHADLPDAHQRLVCPLPDMAADTNAVFFAKPRKAPLCQLRTRLYR